MWRTAAAILLVVSVESTLGGESSFPPREWLESTLGGGSSFPPTPFESFATRTDVVVRETKLIGELRSHDSVATVWALVVDAVSGGRTVGLRIDLQNNTAMDSVYLGESQIAIARSELAELDEGIPYLLDPNDGSGALWRTQGTGRCWNRDPAQRILCPDYGVGPDGPKLGLGALGGPHFYLPGSTPSDMIELIESASAYLDDYSDGDDL